MNEVTGSRKIPGIERLIEIIVKSGDLLVMEVDSQVDFIAEDEPWRGFRSRRLSFFAVCHRFAGATAPTERNIEIDVQLGPVFERKRFRDYFRIISTVFGVAVDILNKSVVYDAEVIVDRERLNCLSPNALALRAVAWS